MQYTKVVCKRDIYKPAWYLTDNYTPLPPCIYQEDPCSTDKLSTIANGGFKNFNRNGGQYSHVHCKKEGYVLAYEGQSVNPMHYFNKVVLLSFQIKTTFGKSLSCRYMTRRVANRVSSCTANKDTMDLVIGHLHSTIKQLMLQNFPAKKVSKHIG